jgi:hypothetical protein
VAPEVAAPAAFIAPFAILEAPLDIPDAALEVRFPAP